MHVCDALVLPWRRRPDAAAASLTLTSGAEPAIAEPDAAQQTRRLPPYRVILHNDDVNTVEHVISTIRKLTPLTLEEAIEKTLEAHERGRSVLLITNRERAELYVEQFASCKLHCTAEPDA